MGSESYENYTTKYYGHIVLPNLTKFQIHIFRLFRYNLVPFCKIHMESIPNLNIKVSKWKKGIFISKLF